MKVLRIHSSRRYPRKVRSGPSEQSIRAAIRQAMLNLKLRIEQAQKHEIRVLKDQNILGKRAPSCTLLNSFDTIKLLKAFGKKKCGKVFKEAVSGAYPHLTEALEVEWATPIPKHHRAVLEADFGSSDDNDERDDEFGPDLGGAPERRPESEEEEEERRKARQAATQGFHPPVSRAPPSRAAREAAAAAAKLAASAEADEDSDHMVLSEIDYARNRVRAIASRRRMMLQHSHSFSVAAAAAEASAASTPSPSSSPTPSTPDLTESSVGAAASSSPSSTPSSSPMPPTPSSVVRGLTPSKRARTAGPAGMTISISAAAAAAAASLIDSDDDSVAPDTPPLSDNELEFLASTSNPRFAPKRSFVPRFRPAASPSSSAAAAAAYASALVVSPVASEQLTQRWELGRHLSAQPHHHSTSKRPRDPSAADLSAVGLHGASPVDSMHASLAAGSVHGAHLASSFPHHALHTHAHAHAHAFPLRLAQQQPAPLF